MKGIKEKDNESLLLLSYLNEYDVFDTLYYFFRDIFLDKLVNNVIYKNFSCQMQFLIVL